MLDFKDKYALITGAGGGIGRQLALDLAARGAILAAVDLNPMGLEETVAQIRLAGGRVTDYVADTAKRLPVVALVDEVLDAFGRIDILVCAAAVRPADPILIMDEWEFHRTLDVNLAGPFFLMQRVAQAMIPQGGGLIVIAAGESPTEGGPAYRASMAALANLIQSAREEFTVYHVQILSLVDFRKL